MILRTSSLKKLFGSAFALLLGLQSAFGQTQEADAWRLTPGQTLERELRGAESHCYRVDLKQGEFLRVRVEQKGIDVLLLLLDAQGKELARTDSPNGDKGFESISLLGDASGTLVLEVRSLNEDAGKGVYVIRSEAVRTANAEDRARVALERERQAEQGRLDALTAEALKALGEMNSSTPPETARAALNKAAQGLEVSRRVKSLEYEALFSFLTARIYEELRDHQKTVEYYEKTLKAINSDKETKASLRSSEITALKQFGRFYENELGDGVKAWKLYNRALSLYGEKEEDEDKGVLLRYMGDVMMSLRFYQKAQEYYFQSLQVFQRLKLRFEEGATLGKLGRVYFAQPSKAAEALKYLLESEKLLEDSPANSDYQNTRLINVGYIYLLYDRLNNRGEASAYRTKARELQAKTEDPYVRFAANFLLAKALSESGQFEEALKIYQEAAQFAADSDMPDKVNVQTVALQQVSLLCLRLGKIEEAKKAFNEAFELVKDARDHTQLAGVLENFGDGLFRGNAFKLAEDYYSYALSVLMAEENRPRQVNFEQVAAVLNKRGKAQLENKDETRALVNLRTALTLQSSLYQQTRLADMLHDRMTIFARLNKRRLAIFFGKQALALRQELRHTLKTFPVETQKSFLKGVRGAYETLAILLIQENRLEEALQILNLYQSQEFFDVGSSGKLLDGTLSFTRHEKSALGELQGLQTSLWESKEGFVRNPNFHKLEDAFKRIEEEFGKPPGEADKAPAVPDVAEMYAALRELGATTGQRPAALYTLIGGDDFYILVVTPGGGIKVFKSNVGADDLNAKTLRFYALLQSPTYDPRPLGKELYDLIFKPIQAELKRQNVRTLMWSLDGSLRYVPMAALFDGERYLVERFQNAVFTRADRERMTRAVSRNWTGTGFGSSQEHVVDLLGDGDTIRFPALPGVTQELRSIFRVGGTGAGVLDGEVFTDTEFTKGAFYESMRRRRPLVHVSSHFAFRPGDDSRSFMLLGDNKALTLNEMKKWEGLFDGVELLTLSACNTAATQPDAYGKEIDGFAELAQRLGAGSVMATLWQVSDDSTPWLMKEFYTTRQSNGGRTKAEALKNAQLALLKGTADTGRFSGARKGSGTSKLEIVVVPDASSQTRSLTRADIIYVSKMDAPLFKHDDRKRFAHPYYWSPFVLYGNWR